MLDKPRLVVWGASGHARVVADVLRLNDEYELVGFLDDVRPERRGERFCDATILGGREALAELSKTGVTHAMIAFGANRPRMRASAHVRQLGFQLATAIHPRSVVARDVEIGAGTLVAAGAIINPGSRIGADVIVNTGATVDHDCTIADGVHVGPGAHLGGDVSVGEGTLLGIGSIVMAHHTIGADVIVAAGAVVVHDIAPRVVAIGVPARPKRPVNDD